MPRLIEAATDSVAQLDDLVDFCRSAAFDPESEEGIASAAPVLAALANNRHFLADFAMDALKEQCAGQLAGNSYSPQVILLHPPEARFFLRANIWPSPADPAYRSCGPASFFYGCPHDHAFSFLTVGYLGPGYWSDYWEIEEPPAGITGEPVRLRFVERAQLATGRMLLYRANRDVHDQAPPERLSVSLNVMPMTRAQTWRRQYEFDLARHTIVQCMNVTSAELMLGLCVHSGGEEGQGLAADFAMRHPDPRMRLAALEAMDSMACRTEQRIEQAELALANDHPLVRAHLVRLLARLRYGADGGGRAASQAAGRAHGPLAMA